MKKLFTLLLLLFACYLAIQFAFSYFGKGEDYSYTINNNGLEIGIDEKSTFRVDKNYDNYYFNININDTKFTFQVNYDFDKRTEVIKDIKYFKNDKYECILPIYLGNITLSDIMCYQNDNLIYYYNIAGNDYDLDKFASGINEYVINNYKDGDTSILIEGINVFKNNLIKDHYICFTNYKGIYNISKNFNSTVYNIELYNKDERNQKLGIFFDEYYLSADYNEEYEFNKFNIINLVKLDTSTMLFDSKISIDSYIQGIIDKKIYLYDKDKKIQYEIEPSKEQVVTVSQNEIKHYDNGWTTMTVAQANNELKFNQKIVDYEDSRYARIDKTGDTTGYYYLYLKTNKGYDVYRMNIQDKNKLTYLFTTRTIDNIQYINNYIYYVDSNNINVYHDSFGIKKLITYNELEFNPNINFYLYAK